jgi:glycerol-3-phosphate acyltransferase PlsY
MHRIPATAKIASNPGTGGAVVLLAACRKLVTPAAVVVAFVIVVAFVVVAAAVVAFAAAVVVALLVAVTFAVSCAIDGRLKTSINKSAKTLPITTLFILIDHLPNIQQITRLAERYNTALRNLRRAICQTDKRITH